MKGMARRQSQSHVTATVGLRSTAIPEANACVGSVCEVGVCVCKRAQVVCVRKRSVLRVSIRSRLIDFPRPSATARTVWPGANPQSLAAR